MNERLLFTVFMFAFSFVGAGLVALMVYRLLQSAAVLP